MENIKHEEGGANSYKKIGWEKNQLLKDNPLHFSTSEEINELSREVAPLILNIQDTIKAEEILNKIFALTDCLAAYRNNATEIYFDDKEEVQRKHIDTIREELGLKPWQ